MVNEMFNIVADPQFIFEN